MISFFLLLYIILEVILMQEVINKLKEWGIWSQTFRILDFNL